MVWVLEYTILFRYYHIKSRSYGIACGAVYTSSSLSLLTAPSWPRELDSMDEDLVTIGVSGFR